MRDFKKTLMFIALFFNILYMNAQSTDANLVIRDTMELNRVIDSVYDTIDSTQTIDLDEVNSI